MSCSCSCSIKLVMIHNNSMQRIMGRVLICVLVLLLKGGFGESNPLTVHRMLAVQNESVVNALEEDTDRLGWFSNCTRNDPDSLGGSVAIKYILWVEDMVLRLSCGGCVPPEKTVFWSGFTFEGVYSAVDTTGNAYRLRGNDLVVKDPVPGIFTYMCYWTNAGKKRMSVAAAAWTFEVVPALAFKRVSVRAWERKVSKQEGSASGTNFFTRNGITLGIDWGEWSQCSACSRVGKRHRLGYCSIQSKNKRSTRKYESLGIYSTPMSCSVFLELHPGVVSDIITSEDFDSGKNDSHALAETPLFMVGYCKVSCKEQVKLNGGPLDELPDKIHVMYSRVSMVGLEEEEEKEKYGYRGSGVWMIHSVWSGIPFGWENFPEIIALLGLVLLQLYLLKVVCSSRKQAN